MINIIYLDNAATTGMSNRVKSVIVKNLNLYGNASSLYEIGNESKDVIERCRNKVGKLLDCNPDDIYFTSGATEGNNFVCNQDQLISCSQYEHPSIINNPRCKQFNNLYKDKTIGNIVSEMFVNNEVGFVNNIEADCKFVHKYNKKFHTDATQAIGNLPCSISTLKVDYLTLSGHKFHAPKGIGILYINGDLKHKIPILYGGGQEKGVRSGTENPVMDLAITTALEDAIVNIDYKNNECMKLKKRVISNLQKNHIDFYLPVKESNDNIPSILNICFSGIDGETLVYLLSLKGICASSGSACHSSSDEVSYVLKALNVPEKYIRGSLRLSFNEENIIEEMDYVCDIIIDILHTYVGK